MENDCYADVFLFVSYNISDDKYNVNIPFSYV